MWDRGESTEHQHRVDEFMRLAKQERPSKPTMPSKEVRVLRAKLILEEALETIEALGVKVTSLAEHLPDRDVYAEVSVDWMKTPGIYFEASGEPDLTEIVDGCCDVIVVTTGTLSACGVDDAVPQMLVDENNLAKFGPGHSYRADGKLVKPPNHKAPDLKAELERQSKIG